MMTNGLVVVVVVALSELVIGCRRRLAAISSSLNSIVRRASLYPVRVRCPSYVYVCKALAVVIP